MMELLPCAGAHPTGFSWFLSGAQEVDETAMALKTSLS